MDLNTPIEDLLSDGSELYHAKFMKSIGKTLKKKFKYIAKIDVGKSTRYFYSLAEYKAFLDGKDKSKEDDSKTAKTSSTQLPKKSSNSSKATSKKSSFKSMAEAGRSFVERQAKKAVKEADKKVDTLKKSAKQLQKKVEKQIPKKAEDALKKIEKEFKNKVEKPVSKKVEVARKETEDALKKIKKELILKKPGKQTPKTATNELRKQEVEKTLKKIKEELKNRSELDKMKEAEERAYAEAKSKTEKADAISKANSPKSWDELEHKDRDYTREEDQTAVNPHHVTEEEASKVTEKEKEELIALQEETGIALFEYHINCQSCTLAYDLRRRGYDVEAAPYDLDETWQPNHEGLSMWYEGVEPDDWTIHTASPLDDETAKKGNKAAEEFIEKEQEKLRAKASATFDEMPDGSYGQFCAFHWYGGGHSVVWEKENGKVTLRDCQINETIPFDKIADDAYYSCLREIYILRTDDKKLTDEALKRVRNVSDTTPIEEALKKIRKRIEKDKKRVEEFRRNRARSVLERKLRTT